MPGQLAQELDELGFVRMSSARMRASLGLGPLSEWSRLRASWELLPTEEGIAANGGSARRRGAVFLIGQNFIWRRTPRSQSQDGERLRFPSEIGTGVAPMAADATSGALINALLQLARTTFSVADAASLWHVAMHQLRVETGPDRTSTSLRALHCQAHERIVVLAVKRSGIAGGMAQLVAPGGTRIAALSLGRPLEALILDPRRVRLGITPIHPRKGALAGHWDILLMTFRKTTEWNS